ncbi:MAG: hypothetical protein H7Y86_17010 [Rhizobacter sp.]|nr:hypothetical protein [Ferruginibacter sp.]
MKQFLFSALLTITLFSCSKSNAKPASNEITAPPASLGLDGFYKNIQMREVFPLSVLKMLPTRHY